MSATLVVAAVCDPHGEYLFPLYCARLATRRLTILLLLLLMGAAASAVPASAPRGFHFYTPPSSQIMSIANPQQMASYSR